MTTIIRNDSGAKLERLGTVVLRYGLVIVLLWIGMLKFTAYEADGVHGLASNSPLLSWLSNSMSVQGFSSLLGVIEITLGILIATRRFTPKLSAIGSMGAIIMFLITLTFLLSTPGVWQPDYGFPFLSPNPGQFLAKDVLLLGAAIYTAGEALLAAEMVEVRR
ncbi:MAG: YkgB family protein [Chitinophagaceae bacterium]